MLFFSDKQFYIIGLKYKLRMFSPKKLTESLQIQNKDVPLHPQLRTRYSGV